MTSLAADPALRLAASEAVLSAAIDAFLSRPDLAPTPRANYRLTLAVLNDAFGGAPLTGAGLAGVVAQAMQAVTARRRCCDGALRA